MSRKTNTLKCASIFATGLLASTALTSVGHAETIISVTQVSYDNSNRPVCTAVRMNPAIYGSLPSDPCTLGTTSTTYGQDRITKTLYDNAGQVTEIDQAFGTSVQRAYARYTYSSNGQKLTEKDANGNLTTLEYDGVDRLKKMRYPSTTVGAGTSSAADYEQYSYDDNDNLKTFRRRDAQELFDCYDALNRVITHFVHAETSCTATGTAKDVYTAYDGLGRITGKRFASLSGSGVSYTYDGLGRIKTTTDINSLTLSYLYDAASARTRLTYPDTNYIGYDLDYASRLKTMGWNAVSGIFSQGYDDFGSVVSETKGSGSVANTYDAFGRLSTMTNNLAEPASPNPTNDISWTFTRNPAGQLLSTDASSAIYDYEELTSYTVNNTHDGLNRDAAIAAVTGGYDARGNLTKDASRTFTYDIENRLLTGLIGTTNLELTYDPEGRLSSYTWNGARTNFLYDGIDLVAEYNASGTMLRRYVHGTGTDDPVVWYEGTGNSTRRYFFKNYQGSVIGYANDSGALQELYAYGPYGEPKDAWGYDYWPTTTRFGYTGQMFLSDARLYYYKARVYDPVFGRFLQTDPIGSKDDLDLYAYVGGDPINRGDPTGLYDCTKEICATVKEAINDITTARDSYKQGSTEYKKLDAILKTLGKEGDHNGIRIQAGIVSGKGAVGNTKFDSKTDVTITIDKNEIEKGKDKRLNYAGTLVHEGDHVDDVKHGGYNYKEDRMSAISAHERRAYGAEVLVYRGMGWWANKSKNSEEAWKAKSVFESTSSKCRALPSYCRSE